MEIAGLLLAAGAGLRYGGPKALVAFDGQLLVERGAEVLRAAGCTPTVVVLGAAAGQVRAAADLGDAMIVDNPDWPTGLASSLRAGLTALADTTADAAVVLLVDMPGVTAAAVRRVAAYAAPDAVGGATDRAARGALATAGYADGRWGHPVLLGRNHWAGVAACATGDTGARGYLRAHADDVRVVPCADVADDTDLDVPALDVPALDGLGHDIAADIRA